MATERVTSKYARSALITGGTMNLGYQAALEIARQKPDWLVVICSRSDNHAAETINKTLHQSNTIFLKIDLGSGASIRSFVDEWKVKQYPPIQALLLNAGLQYPANEIGYSEDGIEQTFNIGHVGNVHLFHLLAPQLAQNARVVVTSSGTHDPLQKTGLPDAEYISAEIMAHPRPSKKNGQRHYSATKLCNVLWTYALHKRLDQRIPDRGITVTAMDPGLMPGTGLARAHGAVARFLWNHILPSLISLLRVIISKNIHTPEASGKALARLAVGDDVAGVSGVYYEGTVQIKSSKDSYNEAKSDDLWHWTVKHVAEDEQEQDRFERFQ